MPGAMPLRPAELLIRCTLAAATAVVMAAGTLTGTVVEKAACTVVAAPALWYLLRTTWPLFTGTFHFADA